MSKSARSWLASLIFLTMVVGLIFFLTFLEIPDKNKELITSIIGMLVGSISMAISIFVGRDPDDVASLKAEIADLNDYRTTLIARLRDAQIDKDIQRRQHEGLQALVISKLSVFAQDKTIGELAVLAQERSMPDEVERWIPEERSPQVPSTMSPIPKRSPLDDILGGGSDK
ncbi:MAG: hypothetical protein CL536_05305 [Alcaligenaceae bacterium]|nr:hypothetical protein [Alcaligenaceae bacterium]